METHRTITDLPLEVLDLIFKNIDSRNDKFQLAKVHEVLGKAFAYDSGDRYRSLTINSFSNHDNCAIILRYCGSTIRHLAYHSGRDDLGKLVEQNCHNVESIEFHIIESNADLMESLILLLKGRVSIKSIGIDMGAGVPVTVLRHLTEFPQLKKLYYSQSEGDAVYEIRKLVDLEELKIMSRAYHERIKILEICAPLKKLRDLSVHCINIAPDEEAETQLMPWPALECLTLKRCLLTAEFPHLPNLKYMTFASCECNIDNLVLTTILRHAISLECMNMDCRPPPFDGDGFLEVLRACKKLREFCIPMRKVAIYRAYVFAMVEILRENGYTPEKPFALWLFDRPKMRWIKRLVAQSSCPGIIDFNVVKLI